MITLVPDRLNLPLPPIYAGRLSSLVVAVSALGIPNDIVACSLVIERTPGADGADRAPFKVAGILQDDGSYRIYCSPWCFQDASENLNYHVMSVDTRGNSRWLGSGQLRVRLNPSEGTAIEPEIIPSDAYAYNPVTKLYHKLVAEVDESGTVTIAAEQEGVVR